MCDQVQVRSLSFPWIAERRPGTQVGHSMLFPGTSAHDGIECSPEIPLIAEDEMFPPHLNWKTIKFFLQVVLGSYHGHIGHDRWFWVVLRSRQVAQSPSRTRLYLVLFGCKPWLFFTAEILFCPLEFASVQGASGNYASNSAHSFCHPLTCMPQSPKATVTKCPRPPVQYPKVCVHAVAW